MPGSLRVVNGARLYVDERGDESAPPLLYIHGGPGQGSYDFMDVQGERLSRFVRLVGVDQRGVLRSDPLQSSPALSVDLLIDDFEELRRQLGYTSWSILGHSAGGAYAVAYALSRPHSVTSAVYSCPSWDGDLADRARLRAAAVRLAAAGEQTSAEVCRALAAKPTPITAADEVREVIQAHGVQPMELSFYEAAGRNDFEEILSSSGLTPEQWDRGDSHASLRAGIYASKLPFLKSLSQPSLLVHGAADLVATAEVVDAFCRQVPRAEIHTLRRSGHFPYAEEPDEYSRVVGRFVRRHAGLTDGEPAAP
jgi:proline iminopeptidase